MRLRKIMSIIHRVRGSAPSIGASMEKDHHRLWFFRSNDPFILPDVQCQTIFAFRRIGCWFGSPFILQRCVSEVVTFDFVAAWIRSLRRLPPKFTYRRFCKGYSFERYDSLFRLPKHYTVFADDLYRIFYLRTFP